MLIKPDTWVDTFDNRPDEEIDVTEMPEVTDFTGAVRGRFYRALKEPVSIRIDSDVLDWFRSLGGPYQTRINAVLRQYVEGEIRKRRSRNKK